VSIQSPFTLRAGVPGRHGSSPGVHRVSPGRLFLGGLLLLRTVAITSACGPSPGEAGGRCKDNGCNTYCDSGSVCDNSTNTCVAGAPVTSSGLAPPICTFAPSSPTCAAGQSSYTCPAGANLWEVRNDKCAQTVVDKEGVATYCCPRPPPCVADTQSQCASPAVSYTCIDPATPGDGGLTLPGDSGPVPDAETDASLGCVVLGPGSGGHDYCCASGDTCFAGPAGYFALLCASMADQLFCLGSAKPPAGCVPGPLEYGGTGVRGYCCDADAGDAGAD